jgi:hypothetical protein
MQLLESSDDDEYYAACEADNEAEAAEDVVVAPISGRGRRMLLPGLPDLAPTTVPLAVQEKARRARTLAYQKQYRENLQDEEFDPVVEITGNQSNTLLPMSEVKNCRLEKGQQVFSNKDYLLLRVKEEANLRGITMKMAKSDASKFVAYSEDVLDFYVQATIAYKTGCTVKHAIVRPMDVDNTWNGVIPGVKIHPIHKAEEDAAEAAAAAKAAVASSPQPPKRKGRGKAVKSKGKTKTVNEGDTPFALYPSTNQLCPHHLLLRRALPSQLWNRNLQHRERWPLHTSIMT